MLKNNPQTPFKRLLEYLRPKKKKVQKAAIHSILNKIFDLAPPLLIGLSVDIVVQKEASFISGFGLSSVMSQLGVVAILTLLVWGLESLYEYWLKVAWRNLAQEVQHDLRKETYNHVQKLELAYFEDKSTGQLISVLNDDINQLERFLDDGANDLIQVATTVVIIGAIFFTISPTIALISFVPMPFIILGSLYFQKKIQPRYQAVRTQVGGLNSLLSNNISGMSTIKSYGAEKHESQRLEKKSLEYSNVNRWAIRLSSSFSPLIRMVILMGFLAAMLLGGYYVDQGVLAVGSYSVVIFMTQRLLWPLTRLGQTLDLYQRAMASTQRIFGLLDTRVQLLDGKESLALDQVRGELYFEGVGFRYQTGETVLRDLDFTIQAGKTYALVGATGSGKSTLIKLLLRFYDPTQGRILLDGLDIKNVKLHDLRQVISYVHQDPFLFHGSVLENIRYGSFDKSEEEVVRAAQKASAHDFIQNLPEGYQTVVGERGQKLSGGQRQRLAIARAVLKDSPVFIFDEATSSVDNETEAAIQRSLEKITQDKTTFIVAHRLSTIVNADQIYLIEDGRIKERGTHEELVKTEGAYSHLWKVQTGAHLKKQATAEVVQ